MCGSSSIKSYDHAGFCDNILHNYDIVSSPIHNHTYLCIDQPGSCIFLVLDSESIHWG